jgi:hypothetical protein
MAGERTLTYRLSGSIRELFRDLDLLADLGSVKPVDSALKTA